MKKGVCLGIILVSMIVLWVSSCGGDLPNAGQTVDSAEKMTVSQDENDIGNHEKDTVGHHHETSEYNNVEETAHDHDYSVSVTEATCTEDGERLYLCDCGDRYTEVIEKSGHDMVEETSEATCTEDGATILSCQSCDYEERTVIEATGHQYELEYTEEAQCGVDGYQQYECLHCRDTYSEEIPAKTHRYLYKTIDATCTEGGYKLYECDYCDEAYTEALTEAKGHNMQITGICSRCNEDLSVNMGSRLSAPLEDTKYGFSFDHELYYLGFSWQAINESSDTIKYCTIHINGYNAVGDIIKKMTYKITGPVEPGEEIGCKEWDYIGIKSGIVEIEIDYVMIEYTNGEVECGYYGYSTDTINKKL